MSAIHPFPGNKARQTPAEEGVSERERALEAEAAFLRAELLRLRSGAFPAAVRRGGTSAGLESGILPDGYGELFTALGSVFPIGVFRILPDGTLTYVDSMMQQIFGLSAQEFPNYGWLRCVHPDDLPKVQEQWHSGVGQGVGATLEFRIFRPDSDSPLHLVARNIPQYDEQGRLVSQLGFVQDISHLRKLEAEARIKDELNRQIIASSPDCTKVLDLDGRVLQMTAQGCRLVEVDDFEQVRGSDWPAWWPDDGQSRAREALEQAKKLGSARFIAFGLTFKGTPKWWDTVVSPITDSDGKPVMMLAVSRDITEPYEQQKQIRQLNTDLESRVRERTAELGALNERLRQTLQEAQTLYNQAPCGYHSVNADGTYVLINQTELDWLGYARDEVVGKMRFRDFVQPAYLPVVKDRIQSLMRGEKLESAELGMRRRDGSTFVALLSSTAVVDSRGPFCPHQQHPGGHHRPQGRRRSLPGAGPLPADHHQQHSGAVRVFRSRTDLPLCQRQLRPLDRHPLGRAGGHAPEPDRPPRRPTRTRDHACRRHWRARTSSSKARGPSPTGTVFTPASSTRRTGKRARCRGCSSSWSTSPNARPPKTACSRPTSNWARRCRWRRPSTTRRRAATTLSTAMVCTSPSTTPSCSGWATSAKK